jgi:hypothetical protein
MKSEFQRQNRLARKLLLDMKALALLHPSDNDLRAIVRTSILESRDDQVKRLVDSLKADESEGVFNGMIIAIGELLTASFLMVSGILMIAPFLVGARSASSLVGYFSSAVGSVVTAPAFLPFLPELVVLLAILLLMSSLYLLRRAAGALKAGSIVAR